MKIAYYADAKVVGAVSANVFMPKPNVESVLVRLVRRSAPPVAVDDAEALFTLVRAGFATRRKTLRNALAGMVDADGFVRRRHRSGGACGDAHARRLGSAARCALTRSPN